MSKLAHSDDETMEAIERMAENRYSMEPEEYSDCYKAAENAFKELNAPLTSAVKDVVDIITTQVHDYMQTWLEGDLSSNFASTVKDRSERIIKGLFNGSYDEATAKQWLASYDFAEYREKVATNYPQLITDALVEELTKENHRLKERISYMERR